MQIFLCICLKKILIVTINTLFNLQKHQLLSLSTGNQLRINYINFPLRLKIIPKIQLIKLTALQLQNLFQTHLTRSIVSMNIQQIIQIHPLLNRSMMRMNL